MKVTGSRKVAQVVVGLCVVAGSTRTAKAEDVYDETGDQGRTLGGLRYVPFEIVDSPFFDSRFTSGTSLALLRLDESFVGGRVTGAEIEPRLDLIAAGQTVGGTWKLARWLGVELVGSGSTVMAIDRASAVAIGAHFELAARGAAAVRVVRTHNLQVTVRGEVDYIRDKGITPAFLPSSPLVDQGAWVYRPIIAAALTFTKSIGLQASTAIAVRDIQQEPDVSYAYDIAAGLSFDMNPIALMLLLGGRATFESERIPQAGLELLLGTGGSRVTGEAGVFYHGRRDLDLGGVVELTATSDQNRYFAQLRVNYYF